MNNIGTVKEDGV